MIDGSVELRAVTKRFEGASRAAVEGVDLAIGSGERFVIVGPSGSGKTTVLRIVAGLESPSSGAIYLGGKAANDLSAKDRGVSMVFQQPAVYPHLSVAENLAFGLKARGIGRGEVKSRVGEMAEWVGLAGMLDRRPKTLSGGELQRVAIGRAAVTRPAILLLDEPFTSLDAPLRAATRATLLNVHKRLGGTLILVTHDQTEALAIGDRIALMREGKMEAVGTARLLYANPPSPFVGGFLGDPPMAFLPCEVAAREISLLPADMVLTPKIVVENRLNLPDFRGRIGIRPEDVALGVGGEEAMTLPAVVERVEPRGHESIVVFRVEGHLINARVSPRKHLEPGTPTPIHILWEDLRFYDAQDRPCSG